MVKLKLLFVLIMYISSMVKGSSQELPLTHFTSVSEVNPLPSALVTQIYQDRQGFIWFANFSSGLVRHDGVDMDLYDQEDGLKDPHVWQILEDDLGYLWVSSNSGLVVSEKPLGEYRNGSRIHFSSSIQNISLSEETFSHNQQMAKDSAGRIWVGTTYNGILQYFFDEKGRLTVDTLRTTFGGDDDMEVHALASGQPGQMFASLEGGKLASFGNGKPSIFFSPAPEDLEENFTSILEDKAGRIWAYNQNGRLFRFLPGIKEPRLVYSGTPSNVNGITNIAGGKIFANNGESGIVILNAGTGNIHTTYSRKNGLLSNNVYGLLQDREGNIWIAQSGGVSKLRYNFRAFENYTAHSVMGEKPVLSSGAINTVFLPTGDIIPGRFWTGSEEGVTVVDEQGNSQFLTQEDGLASDWVNGISSDEQGRVWIATTQGVTGIFFSDFSMKEHYKDVREIEILGKSATVVSLEGSPPSIASEKLKVYDEKSNTAVNTSVFAGVRSLFGIIGEQTFNFTPEHGLPPSIFHAVAFDDVGRLWIGTRDKGLYRSTQRFTFQKMGNLENVKPYFEQVWSEENGAPANQIEKLLFHNGKMWIGTPKGLFALGVDDSQIKTVLTAEDGLPWNNAVSFALFSETGNMWIGTNGGLAEVDPLTGKVLRTVTRQNGLVANEVWLYGSVQISEEGEVFYGTSEGLSIYKPALDVPNDVPPVLHLKSADLYYKSDSRNEAAFEFVALSFANVSDVRYRTRLLGYDKNWSPPSTEKKLRYTNLPAYLWPKEYVLEVMAENGSGVFSEAPLQHKFEIKPVWWLQWWAFLAYLLILTSAVFIVDRVQRTRLIKRERERSKLYEAQLEAETAIARSHAAESQAKALQAENEKKEVELEKAHQLKKAYEELKAAQGQVVQAEKMASLGRLATGIAHEIKNPLNFINNFAQLSSELVEELIEARKNGAEIDTAVILKDLKLNSNKIEEHGKRADAIVRSMMRHARGGTSSFEHLDINELVNRYADIAYHGKRAENPEFHATIKKDLQLGLGMIKGMEQEIGQVLLNLIGNSLDAVWEKKMGLNDSYEPEVAISTFQREGKIEIIVRDNGPGIPQENRERIFEPFFTTKPTGEGTGLGLSLSYTIITEGHEGSLQLISNKETGAAFLISLPVSGRESLAG